MDRPELREISQIELDEVLAKQVDFLKHGRFADQPKLTNVIIKKLSIPEDFSFRHMDLSGTEFQDVDLVGCRFMSTTLTNTNFNTARIKRCEFVGSKGMSGSSFGQVTDTKFYTLSMDGCVLHEARFKDCEFVGVDFKGARLEYLNFERCKFNGCSFTGAKATRYLHFHGACLTGCDLQDTDLGTSDGYVFDATKVEGLRLPVRSKDPWSTLLRTYTGSNMLFNLFFLAAFFSPFILKGIALIALANIESDLLLRIPVLYAKLFPQQSIPVLHAADICQAFGCKELPVWRALLGPTTSIWVSVAGIVLLLYNALRALLTWRIAPLKEEERVSGETPHYMPHLNLSQHGLLNRDGLRANGDQLFYAYGPMSSAHKLISGMFYFAIALSGYHLFHFFAATIIVPA